MRASPELANLFRSRRVERLGRLYGQEVDARELKAPRKHPRLVVVIAEAGLNLGPRPYQAHSRDAFMLEEQDTAS
jgi:hypothetical protein